MSITTITQQAVDKTFKSIEIKASSNNPFSEMMMDIFSENENGNVVEKNNNIVAPTIVKNNVEAALTVLFAYIPTEVIALYVTVLGALSNTNNSMVPQWITFFLFIFLTPVVVWLVYAAKLKNLGLVIPIDFSEWPKWEMTASTIAFLAWAFALPNSPFKVFESWYSPAIAGVTIVFTSTVLGLISPFFDKKA